MEYSIQALAALAGITTRTLRWYDKIGLLKPRGHLQNGYRCYGAEEVDRLQQILFYRALGMELKNIREILDDPAFDRMKALRGHLAALQCEQKRIAGLIEAVEITITAAEKEEVMDDQKKFEAFKKRIVEENEAKYGTELREKYGDQEIDEANARTLHMTQEEYWQWKELEREILAKLATAVKQGADPKKEGGEEIVLLHKRWLSMTQNYSAAKHRGIAMLYTMDDRFKIYYDQEISGCAEFLTAAVLHWIKE